MKNYKKPNKNLWSGRLSNNQLYLHEIISCIDLENETLQKKKEHSFAILGYSCDEGVRRNHGRVGAADGPDMIRKMLAPLSNHFNNQFEILDIGNITCKEGNLEATQDQTSYCIASLLDHNIFPIVLGGGHDLAYAHYNGIKKQYSDKTIGIINLDAHFDLRKVDQEGNSGTPFFQIAKENDVFKYLCLGIQKATNNRELFEIADSLEVDYILNDEFNIENNHKVLAILSDFITSVDHVYLTIDLDGFSSAYAPGVSAPSPLGFSTAIVIKTIEKICKSNKLISVDLVELNPKYDIDNSTARLASRLIYQIINYLNVGKF